MITAPPEVADRLAPHADLLATLCIVSEVAVERGPEGVEWSARAVKSSHPKCERCWNLRPTVGDGPRPPDPLRPLRPGRPGDEPRLRSGTDRRVRHADRLPSIATSSRWSAWRTLRR